MDRFSGPFPNPNVAGLYCSAALVISWGLANSQLSNSPNIRRNCLALFYFTFGLFFFSLLVWSGSRAAYLASIIGICFWLYSDIQRREYVNSNKRFILVSGILCAIVSAPFLLETSARFIELNSSQNSIDHRLSIWKAALIAGVNFPEGIGRKEFEFIKDIWLLPPSAQSRYDGALSAPLTFLAEQGILAFGLYFLIFGFFILLPIVMQVRLRSIPMTVKIAQAVVLSCFVCGFFQSYQRLYWWWLLLGIGILLMLFSVCRSVGANKILKYSISISVILSAALCAIVYCTSFFLLDRRLEIDAESKIIFISSKTSPVNRSILLGIPEEKEIRNIVNEIGSDLLSREFSVGITTNLEIPKSRQLTLAIGWHQTATAWLGLQRKVAKNGVIGIDPGVAELRTIANLDSVRHNKIIVAKLSPHTDWREVKNIGIENALSIQITSGMRPSASIIMENIIDLTREEK